MFNNRLLFLIALAVFVSCKQENAKKINFKKDKISNLYNRQIKSLLNKEIHSVNTILADSIVAKNKVIMIYDGFDCSTCIDLGFKLVKEIDSINKIKKCYVIGTQSNFHQEQVKNSYFEYIFNDKNDLIRKELKYVHTPIILYINNRNKVSKVLYPNYNRSRENILREREFVNFVINKRK